MKEIFIDYTTFKNYVESLSIDVQYFESTSIYYLCAKHDPFIVMSQVTKGTSDATDFEENYKSTANKPLKSITEPSNELSMQMNAIEATIAPSTTDNIDFKVENYGAESYTYKYLWGGMIFTDGNIYGDNCKFQIIDIDDMLGYGAGTVVKEYIKKVYIDPKNRMEFHPSASGLIPVGLYLRCIYTNTDQSPTKVYINYDLNVKDGE